ncbi:MAG: epoxyqueuosine reductase QueH [bacterium]|nr:epoxyqueuosine reductase QueH [bacterium]
MEKFLLHVCCAPCSIVVIDELKNQFDLTVIFYNPNIFPETEYLKRKFEVIKICGEWGIMMIDHDYEAEKWYQQVAKGLKDEKEGGERCVLCFRFRLAKVAEYAFKNNFKIFGSTLTSGRNKKAEVVHPIGQEFANYYKIKFHDVDWKKGGRQERGRKMIVGRGIYRQDYCGCAYSMRNKVED